MEILGVGLAMITGLFIGYNIERLKHSVKLVQKALKEEVVKKKPVEETKSTIVDPLDIVAQAQYEHEQKVKQLNPDYEE